MIDQFQKDLMVCMEGILQELKEINGNTKKKSTGTPSKAKGKKKYGNYKHVLLTDEQYEKVKQVYGDNTEVAIQYLDEQIETKGYQYNNHQLVLTKSDSWARKNIFQKLGMFGMTSQPALKKELF